MARERARSRRSSCTTCFSASELTPWCVCVCVCEREREREKARERYRERERERERELLWVCAREGAKEREIQ